MSQAKSVLGLDIGAARIGVALADESMRIAIPFGAFEADGTELKKIQQLIEDRDIHTIVVGYPRNQSGEPTKQTVLVEAAAAPLNELATVVFQDESLTSVMAEERLKARAKPYTKADIDAEAAVIILQDYLETH